MLRLVLGPDGEALVDMAGGSFGRGAHVHARPHCIAKACQGGLSRPFKQNVRVEVDQLATQVGLAADRRIEGLLLAARRTRMVAIGADATTEALAKDAPLVVVARDAGTIVERSAIARAIASGRAVAWGDKARLGDLLGHGEVAVCAILDTGIAKNIDAARVAADAASSASGARAQDRRASEVRR
jgi:predicted RNA-binding protein YlxR (DUF448 family)